jgi:hypothetical protein
MVAADADVYCTLVLALSAVKMPRGWFDVPSR